MLDSLSFLSIKELKHTSFFAVATVTANGIFFLQNVLFAFLLSLDDFGRFTLAVSVYSFANTLNILGLDSVITRYANDRAVFGTLNDLEKHVFNFWMKWSTALTLVLLFLGFVLTARLGFVDIKFFPDLFCVVVAGLLSSFTSILQQEFVAIGRPFMYSFYLVGGRLLTLLLTAVFYFALGHSLSWLSFGFFLAASVMFTIALSSIGLAPFGKMVREKTAAIRKLTLPLAVNSLSGLGFTNGFRILLSTMLSLRDLALFALAGQISSSYYMVTTSVSAALTPRVYGALHSSSGKPESIAFYVRSLVIGGLIMLVFVGASSFPFLHYFKNGNYFGSFWVVLVLLLGQFVFILYSYPYTLLIVWNESKYLTFAMLCSVAVSISVAIILSRLLGAIGAAIAVFLGYSAQAGLAYLFVTYLGKRTQLSPADIS